MLDSILLPQARSRWMLPALRSLTPDAVANILSQALPARSPLHEQQLYLLMQQTWPRLCKNISEVKNAVINLPWRTAQPEGLPAALPRELLDKARLGMRGDPFTGTLGWEGMLRHLLDAWFRGISVVELIWEARGRWILPKCAVHVPPWHYGWAGTPSGINSAPPPPASAAANTGHLVLYPDASSTNGQPFPPNKFLVGVANTYGSHPSGGALLRCLAWWWCAANFSSAWLLSFAQTFGQPLRVVKYAAEYEGIRSELGQMLEDMGHSAWAVIPEGTTIDFVENSRSASDNPQALLLEKADHVCDILILG